MGGDLFVLKILHGLCDPPQDRRVRRPQWKGENNTHGPMTIETLVATLLEDVALATTRPGSWEGGHMGDLLQGHGYRLP